MANFPLKFTSQAEASGEIDVPWLVQSGDNRSLCAIPSEFGGDGGGFSPEDFFLQAAINCFVGTFKVMAKLSKINFTHLAVSGSLEVDKDVNNKVVMKSVHLSISIEGCDRADRIQGLVAKVIRDGYILNSIKSDISYELVLSQSSQSSLNEFSKGS